MKILYLTARQPYPVIKGDQIIAYEQIKELSKKHDIYLVSFYEDDYEVLKEEMSRYCKGMYLFHNSKLSKMLGVMKTFYNLNSIQSNCFYKLKIKGKINKIFEDIKPDVVHVQSFRMAEYFRKSKVKKSIDLIDAYSYNMKKRAMTSTILKPLWYLEYLLLRRYEQKILRDYDFKTIVASRDKEYLKDNTIVVNPNGTSFEIESKDVIPVNNDIVFQGNMSYYPNVEAAEYIAKELFPRIREFEDSCKLHIVGGSPSERVKILAKDHRITVTGYVEDMQKYLNTCKIAMYPIFSATGMQNKVLEAMGAGIPCIISTQCEAGIIGLEHEKNVLVAKTSEQYIEYYKKLIFDKKLYMFLRNNAYEFIRKNYSWEKNCYALETLWGINKDKG